MPFTTTICNNILDFYFGKTSNNSLTSASDIYLALCSNDPEADGGTIEELSGNGYERVWLNTKIANARWPVYLTSASARAITNAEEIHFNKATAAWGEVKGFAVYSAQSGGTLIYYAKLDNPITVDAEEIAMFDPGELKIGFADKDVSETTA